MSKLKIFLYSTIGTFLLLSNSVALFTPASLQPFQQQPNPFGLSLEIGQEVGSVRGIAIDIIEVLQALSLVIMSLLFLVFVWSVVVYLYKDLGSTGESKETAKNRLFWSVIGVFIGVSIWGILKFIGEFLGISDELTIFDILKLLGL